MGSTYETIKKFVHKIIDENKIAVFSKTECPYCIKAISILKGYNVNMHVEQIEKNANMADIQSYFKELTGKSSVPRIFINKENVGGCDDWSRETKPETFRETPDIGMLT
uniref:Putative glutaredoxin n=1 Tax=Plasmodium berghei TaxID=5821 RepID=Q95WV3_PLABE|nr:putative glutaredoxin [Plasmodium berghei]